MHPWQKACPHAPSWAASLGSASQRQIAHVMGAEGRGHTEDRSWAELSRLSARAYRIEPGPPPTPSCRRSTVTGPLPPEEDAPPRRARGPLPPASGVSRSIIAEPLSRCPPPEDAPPRDLTPGRGARACGASRSMGRLWAAEQSPPMRSIAVAGPALSRLRAGAAGCSPFTRSITAKAGCLPVAMAARSPNRRKRAGAESLSSAPPRW
mmetsp:Transcript_51346/g.120600  ORF Transcript_51346/g.120600 Transcript_51346/m.120600 type:complete len:208 (-) Transcript_51346:116-739(-)